jgi:hypothetical protein
LLATGTNCLAAVWVRGLSRVPLPPLKIKPFKAIPFDADFGVEYFIITYLSNSEINNSESFQRHR